MRVQTGTIRGVPEGMDAVEKVRAEQSNSNQQAAYDFIEATLDENLGGENLHKILKDGTVLCRLMNVIKPGAVPRISNRPLPFLQMENISNFLNACKEMGIQSKDLFQTTDLYEGKDMGQVVITILNLARVSGRDSFIRSGPVLSSLYSNSTTGLKDKTKSVDSLSTTGDRKASSTNRSNPSRASFSTEGKSSTLKPGASQISTGERIKEESFGDSPSKPRVSNASQDRDAAKGEKLAMADDGAKEVAQYQLGNCIGRGQFGAVYKGLNMETGQIVAIKRIPLGEQNQAEVEDLMNEVTLLESLDHPNIVKYLGFLKTDSMLNIVLEFVENGSLLTLLKQFGTMGEKLVVNYAARMLDGLSYLHEKGVVHCDLKAANILTTKNGEVKLTDFGVSKQLNVLDKSTSAVVGTPNWMAPEVIELSGAVPPSDIWSLACTLVELLTGHPPYWDLLPMTTLFRIVEDDAPPFPEGISPDLTNFFTKCFQKDISKRWTAKALSQHDWIVKNARPFDAVGTMSTNSPAHAPGLPSSWTQGQGNSVLSPGSLPGQSHLSTSASKNKKLDEVAEETAKAQDSQTAEAYGYEESEDKKNKGKKEKKEKKEKKGGCVIQ